MSKILTILCHTELGSGCGRRSCPRELLLCLEGLKKSIFLRPAPTPSSSCPPSPRQPLGSRKMTIRANIFCKSKHLLQDKENVVSCRVHNRGCSWQGQKKSREMPLIAAANYSFFLFNSRFRSKSFLACSKYALSTAVMQAGESAHDGLLLSSSVLLYSTFTLRAAHKST